MARLIDADALIEKLTKYKFGAISNDIEREFIKETALNFINEQPTAYDVDAVVEKLEADVIHPQCSVPFRILYEDFKKRAIQIVKDGGSDAN